MNETNYASLKNALEEISSKFNTFKRGLDEQEDSVKSLKSTWAGGAADQFYSTFNKIKAETEAEQADLQNLANQKIEYWMERAAESEQSSIAETENINPA